MKEKFITSSINFISKYQECNDLKIKQLKYGLAGIYSLVIKLSVVILISLILKTFKETFLFLIFYAGIRTFSFGIHAKSNLACWISTIIMYNVIPFILKYLTIPNIYNIIIIIIALLSMIFFAPADTPKRPLIRKEKRKKCKIISIIIVLLYTIIYFKSNNTLINNSLIYALLVQSIIINPLTYKITNTRYNNYKYYHKNKV